ncbi:MAG: putative sugar O-methyltransferase [Thermodesulfobacteriota bacterium]
MQVKELIQAINSEDFVSLNSLLSNFHRLPFSHATGGGFGDYNAYRKHPLLYRYLFSYQWHKYRKTYLDSSYDLNEIDWPSVGNPVGMQVNGHVWSADVFRYYYYANQFLELFGEKEHPVICEIGCGFGAVTYATLKKRKAIPESLIVSSYFLMTNFPNKKTLLFGEEDIGSINLEGFDMIFIPTYAIETLDDKTVDLFFNSNSFSEMKASSAKKYLDEIERICKKYFLHVNHTAEFTWKDENENEITNIKSTDLVPDKEFFRKKYQKKRIFSSVRDEIFYLQYKAEHFAFFYERIGT